MTPSIIASNIIARAVFEKAIYLEPNYYEALIYLTRLKEHHGDLAAATVLQRRIQRLGKLPNQ